MPLHHSQNALARSGLEVLRLGQIQCHMPRLADQGFRQRMLGWNLGRGGQSQRFVFPHTIGSHICDLRPAHSEGSGLVEGHHIKLL